MPLLRFGACFHEYTNKLKKIPCYVSLDEESVLDILEFNLFVFEIDILTIERSLGLLKLKTNNRKRN